MDAIGDPRDRAERIVQTHASVVYLLGDRAWKVKKPVDFGFLDYSTPERRRWACEEEVRLNRRWGSELYLGVVELPDGEPAVEMRRYPDGATLLEQLDRADAALLERVGRRLAELQAACPTGPRVVELADWPVVAGNHRENFDQTEGTPHCPPAVHAALRRATERGLAVNRASIERRARTRAREIHGDLRLQHTLVEGDRIAFVDCVEFNERFRFADPLADVAFLAMDLGVRGRPDLAEALVAGWEAASGDREARALLPLELAYRSIVRAKVAGFEAGDPSVPAEQAARAAARARRHWLWAAGVLLDPADRPCLLGVGGLPGTGKSTISAHLARAHGMSVVRADVVRKELAGLPALADGRAAVGSGMYAPERKNAVYTECLRRAAQIVSAGGRALVDATFSDPARRDALRALGVDLGVPCAVVLCEAPAEVALARMAGRGPDASDATPEVYRAAAATWSVDPASRALDTGGSLADTVAAADALLIELGLAAGRG